MPECTMLGFLKVWQDRVWAALQWLKANNALYTNIAISKDRLDEPPDDDIPEEILECTQSLNNMEQLDEEHSVYVVENDDLEAQGANPLAGDVDVSVLETCHSCIHHIPGVSTIEDHDHDRFIYKDGPTEGKATPQVSFQI